MQALYSAIENFINRSIKIILYTLLLLLLSSFIRVIGYLAVKVIEQTPQPIVYGARPLSQVQQLYAVPIVAPTIEEYIAELSIADKPSTNILSAIAEAIAGYEELSPANLSSVESPSIANLSSINSPSLANKSSINSPSLASLSSVNSLSTASLSSIESVSTANKSSINSVSIVALA